MALDFLKQGGLAGLDFVTGGASRLLPEDTMAKIPIFGPLSGARTDEQKRLLAKQKQQAEEAEKRRIEMQRTRMNALGQSLLAFNPQNQMMAEMFGAQAAFSPQQFAQMGADPSVAGMPWGTGTDAQRQAQYQDQQRRQRIGQQMTPLGPGPAPLRLPPPQPGRRF